MSTSDMTTAEVIEKAEALLEIALDEPDDSQKMLYTSIGVLYAAIAIAKGGEPKGQWFDVGVLPKPRISVMKSEMEEIV